MDYDPHLIFDIGLHKGLDAEFYLRKGFRVVGVEARSDLAEMAAARNRAAVDNGRLKIINRALWHKSNDTVSFFVNPVKDDWGSLFAGAAIKGTGVATTEIQVPTISLLDLIEQHGHPYYIKCDIEGGDAIFVRQLLSSSSRPAFISIEATSVEDIAVLSACGYDRFQIVNQYLNPYVVCPNPSLEGEFAETSFTHEMSGLFGRDLPANRWTDTTGAIDRYSAWRRLNSYDEGLAVGWLDIHAANQVSLRPTTSQ